MNAIVQIQAASRQGAHLLVQLFGGPQCGKTMSALLLARGIAGPNGKVGCLDTESGRAKFFSDKIPGGFFHADLSPPFTADRYKQAIEEFVKFGCDVLVIDSFSHVWNGPGGVLEQADTGEANGKKGLQKWLKPKVEYRKLIGFLLSTRIHIIFCSRGKQPVEERSVGGRKEFVTLPWEPVQDKHLKYEMTVVLPMVMNGTFETTPDRLKAPGDIKHLFTGAPITVETGKQISDWVGGSLTINHAHELLRKHANDAASDGVEAFRKFWAGLSKPDRAALQPNLANYQSIAKTADEERAMANGNGNGQHDDPPDDPFASQGDAPVTITKAEPPEVTIPDIHVHTSTDGQADLKRWHADAMAAIPTLGSAAEVELFEKTYAVMLTRLADAKRAWHADVADALRARVVGI